jgi:hypothetical protein
LARERAVLADANHDLAALIVDQPVNHEPMTQRVIILTATTSDAKSAPKPTISNATAGEFTIVPTADATVSTPNA